MQIVKGRLNKAGLLRVPEQERRLFLAVAHLQNEISVLLRTVLWSSDYSSENEAVVHGQISISFVFLKLLAGKLQEGWAILEKFFFSQKSLSLDFRANAKPNQIESLDALASYFGKRNLIHDVRSNFAFHYSPTELDAALVAAPDELDLYIELDGNANTLYYFAEVMANRAMLERIVASDGSAALKRFNDEVIRIGGHFTQFGQGLMSYVIRRHSPAIWKEPAAPIAFAELPSFAELHFPWFADTSGGLRRKAGPG